MTISDDAVLDSSQTNDHAVGQGEPRARLRALRDRIWSPLIKLWRVIERSQFWIDLVLVIGGTCITAISGAREGPLQPNDIKGASVGFLTAKGVFVCLGAMMALCGGALLIIFRRPMIDAIEAARELSALADEHLSDRSELMARQDRLRRTADQIDLKRRFRLQAIDRMLESVESALIERLDTTTASKRLLLKTISPVMTAIDVQTRDFFTLSIFRREYRGSGERMYRIAGKGSDLFEEEESRSFGLGFGYTGVAWARAARGGFSGVVESDTTAPHCAETYPLEGVRDIVREFRYQSVAAIPILVRRSDEIWGVVTATVDRPGVFRPDESALGIENVAVIRDLARFGGLLASLDHAVAAAQGTTVPRIRSTGDPRAIRSPD